MLDKILKSLSADPNLDDKVTVARMVGGYIRKHPNGAGVDLTPSYIKELAFPSRERIREQKEREIADQFLRYVEDQMEKQRVENIRKNNAIALSTIYDKTKELRGESDKISQRSWQIEQNLTEKHENLKQRLESLQEENKSLLEKQLERIEVGEKQVGKRLSEVFAELDEKFPVLADEMKRDVLDFENRLRAEKQAEKEAEANRPKPVYEQVLIKETGQIIEVMREDG